MNETPDTLFEKRQAWAQTVAKRFCARKALPAYLHDDMENSALWGLCLACRRWFELQAHLIEQTLPANRMERFLFRRVEGAMKMELRRLRARVECVELSPDLPAQAEDVMAHHDVKFLLSRLTRREALVLRRRFLEGRDLREVGSELGVTRERVRQIEVRALVSARRMVR